jgi:4-hydroxymandelate oxidase
VPPTRRDVLISTAAMAGVPAWRGVTADAAGAAQQPSASLHDLLSISDFQEAARRRMSHMAYEYVEGGAADEITLRWNQEALQRLRICPRVLTDVSRIDTRLTVLDQQQPVPILLAPTGYHATIHPDGELATARGAGRAGTTLVVSTSATTTIEDVARVATGPLWFRLYMQPEREFTADLVRLAEAAGCRALCVAVDSPVAGPQNRIQRARFALPAGIEAPMNPLANRQRRSTSTTGGGVEPFRIRYPATWADISWLKSLTRLPVLLKGILHPADAEMAVSAGVDGIIVSNHGARNLDTAPATIEVLPAIVDRVAGRIPVLMDGGIRRGTDVLKALALGANATLGGRPYLYGLAAAGAEGVTKVVEILRTELEMAMALTGCATIAAIGRSHVSVRPDLSFK